MRRILRSTLLWLASAAILGAAADPVPLKAGDRVPDVTLRTESDGEVRLQELVAKKPTVLVFYRGGWCPYCTRHLQELAGIEGDLRAAGAQILAISMDQPSKLKSTPKREALSFTLLSDSDALAAKAFGIAFQVEDALVARYKSSFNIDLEDASGRTHHLLPHPAVFVAEPSGTIRFAHVNTDYKVRLEPAKVLAAAREAVKAK